MKNKIIIVFLLIAFAGFNCSNEKIKSDIHVNFSFYNSYSKVSVEFKDANYYEFVFYEKGLINLLRKKSKNDNSGEEYSFHPNQKLFTYTNGMSEYITNHLVCFSDRSKIDHLDLVEKIGKEFCLNQSIVFNEQGIINTYRSHFLLIDFDTLSIKKSDIMTMKIVVVGKKNNNCSAIVGDFDDEYNILPGVKCDTFFGKGSEIECKFKAKKGLNIIRGYVWDYSGSGSNAVGSTIYFTKEIFIK